MTTPRASKSQRAKHSWRKICGAEIVPSDRHGVFIRTLTAAEFAHFKETNDLPKPGNISAVTDSPFGRLCWRPGLEWVTEKLKERQLAQRAEQIEQGLSRPAGGQIVDQWMQTNGYSVLETARERLAKELGEKEANARIDRIWLSWAVQYREHERKKKLNRHSRGRRKEDRTQTLVNQLRNPDTIAEQTQRTVEALNHDALAFAHDLRFGHWHPGPFRDQILVYELREGAVMDAVFRNAHADDLVAGTLADLYDDGMLHPEVAKEMNAARVLEQEAMILHIGEKQTGDRLRRAQDHRMRAAEIRRKLGHTQRPKPINDRSPYD